MPTKYQFNAHNWAFQIVYDCWTVSFLVNTAGIRSWVHLSYPFKPIVDFPWRVLCSGFLLSKTRKKNYTNFMLCSRCFSTSYLEFPSGFTTLTVSASKLLYSDEHLGWSRWAYHWHGVCCWPCQPPIQQSVSGPVMEHNAPTYRFTMWTVPSGCIMDHTEGLMIQNAPNLGLDWSLNHK